MRGDVDVGFGGEGAGSTARPDTPSGPAAELPTGGGGPADAAARTGRSVVNPPTLAVALADEADGLLTCVHCGFCLPACPTYTRLGDENDSPRGRLYLMEAVVDGRLDAGSDAFQTHIGQCLGCRACEPVCPSGVPYGDLLELARSEAARARPLAPPVRWMLRAFQADEGVRAAFLFSRVLRATGLPALAARFLPSRGGGAVLRARLALGMLAATAPVGTLGRAPSRTEDGDAPGGEATSPGARGTSSGTFPEPDVGVLTGCVQEGLMGRVNDATVRVLEANGYRCHEVESQACCGALHAHAGDLENARELARRNIAAFERAGVEHVAVNSAGCGAVMKEYGHLLKGDAAWAHRAALFSSRVRDVSELLVERGPRRGGAVSLKVAYDPPCHLLHAQGVDDPPRAMLRAVPGVELMEVEWADDCCGGAGIYGLEHPDLGGRIGRDKVDRLVASGADLVATGNPGCMMQIGAGLRARGRRKLGPVHPVEILDESYQRAGIRSTRSAE